jgi:hypothetical protein
MYSLRHSPDDIARGTSFARRRFVKGVFMANRDDRDREPGQTTPTDDDMVRGRADEMDDMDSDTDEFEDTEDLDEEEEEGDASF